MKCPTCRKLAHVIDSRALKSYTRRRQVCPEGHRFTTYEIPVEKLGNRAVQRLWRDKRVTD